MKVKNQQRAVVYIGELHATVQERKDAVAGLATAIKAAQTKEITMPPEQIEALQSMQKCLVALKPEDK